MDKRKFALTMNATAITTSAVTVLFLCIPYRQTSWWLTCVLSFGTTAYHFLMRLAVGYLLLKLTNYDFDYRRPWFRPRAWEPAFYEKLNIRHWKKNLPTYAPEQFSLKDNSLHRVIQNMCGAELVHETIMVLSFLPLLAIPFFGAFPVFLVTSLLAALYDSIFVLAQRYNRPRMIRIYEKQEAHAHE